MSSSLDDMPAYEHFQDALDAMASVYSVSAVEKSIINEWIEYITFTLCISTPEGITVEIWDKYINNDSEKKTILGAFLQFINQSRELHLKFNHLL
ncbi:MAG: hypothetical protein U0U66_07365 [Cytophagaceae bacterium]